MLLNVAEADINTRTEYGNTPLSIAALGGHERIVRLLLRRSEVDVDVENNNGDTALILAAIKGCKAIARLLHGIDAERYIV